MAIILLFPCYPPMITCQLYDCDAPGPSTVADYVQILLVGGINVIIVWQSIVDGMVHGGYIAFLGSILLMEYISLLDKLVRIMVYCFLSY